MQQIDFLIPKVNMTELRELVVISEHSKRPLIIRGGPGLGKTDATRAHVRDRREQIMAAPEIAKKILEAVPKGSPVSLLPPDQQVYGYIDTRLPCYDPTDLKGFPSLDREAGVSRWLPPSLFPLQSLVDRGHMPARGCWVLEELASAPRAVQVAAFQIVLDREINGQKLADGWFICATSNRLEDRSVINAMPSPLVSRFGHCELSTTAGEWADWAMRNGVDHRLVSYARFKPKALYSFDPNNWVQDTPYACPRSFHALSDDIRAWEECFPGRPVPRHLIVSKIGKEVGDEFFAYLDIFKELPTIEEVCQNPMTAKLPREASAIFAITAALARKANRDNLTALYAYFSRFEKSFEVSAVKDVNRCHKELHNHIAFQNFIIKPENKEIFLGIEAN